MNLLIRFLKLSFPVRRGRLTGGVRKMEQLERKKSVLKGGKPV